VPAFVVGDVHGHLETFVGLLRDAGLVDGQLRWSGRDARLWLLGDLADRGPDGMEAIDLVMRLEREGPVRCLLGNHEVALLAAWHFGAADPHGVGESFRSMWRANGGQSSDLARFRPEHARWIERLPAVARDGAWLLVHSDTGRYLDFGASVEEICDSVAGVLAAGDPDEVDGLLDVLTDRNALQDPATVDRVLSTLGGTRIVHGHTPIAFVTGVDPTEVVKSLEYADGRVLNVDHCLFAGGMGFVTELPSRDEAGTRTSDAAP
jgi:Calcineurin-like phosphoesterase